MGSLTAPGVCSAGGGHVAQLSCAILDGAVVAGARLGLKKKKKKNPILLHFISTPLFIVTPLFRYV
jgi:hypothetical protein